MRSNKLCFLTYVLTGMLLPVGLSHGMDNQKGDGKKEDDFETDMLVNMYAFNEDDENGIRNARKGEADGIPAPAVDVADLRARYRRRIEQAGTPVIVKGDGSTIWFSEDGFNFAAFYEADVSSPVSVLPDGRVHLWFNTRYERDLLRMQPSNRILCSASSENDESGSDVDNGDSGDEDDIYS